MANTLHHGDCTVIMQGIADGSIDLILCDLPYAVTQNSWDTLIPFDVLWEQYKRIIKPNGAIVLTASQPFTSLLIMSNRKWFKYSLVWKKSRKTGFLNAKKMPLRQHEDIVVFGRKRITYNPQGTESCEIANTGRARGGCYGASAPFLQTTRNYPTSVIEFPSGPNTQHPTQKPVALMEYLIRTYSNEGDTVLDNCMGSGTTGIAAARNGRHFVGIEQVKKYFDLAQEGIEAAIAEVSAWV